MESGSKPITPTTVRPLGVLGAIAQGQTYSPVEKIKTVVGGFHLAIATLDGNTPIHTRWYNVVSPQLVIHALAEVNRLPMSMVILTEN